MSEFKNVSIVIAAINETYSLRQTVEQILALCNREDLAEVLIVVCKKTTPECLSVANTLQETALEKNGVPVKVYCQKKPFVGRAYQEAFEQVTGSHAIMMSADLETPPEVIPVFIQEAKIHPDWVIAGSRWLESGSFEGYSKIKWLCNWLFNKSIVWMFFCRNTDLTYAYRIFPVSLLKTIDWQEEKHPFFLETALIPLRLGVKFKEIPARWKARTEGSSVNSFWANFKYFKTAFRIRFSRKSELVK